MASRFRRRYKREHIPTLKVPATIPWLGYAALAIAALVCLHGVVTFFLAAFAVSGKQTTKLKLPLIARAIQWTELTIVSFGVALRSTTRTDHVPSPDHCRPCFLGFLFSHIPAIPHQGAEKLLFARECQVLRKCLLWCWFPSRLVFLGVWVVLAAFQSRYVPTLGHETLSDCSGLWIDKKRCNAVNGSWIAAIIFW